MKPLDDEDFIEPPDYILDALIKLHLNEELTPKESSYTMGRQWANYLVRFALEKGYYEDIMLLMDCQFRGDITRSYDLLGVLAKWYKRGKSK